MFETIDSVDRAATPHEHELTALFEARDDDAMSRHIGWRCVIGGCEEVFTEKGNPSLEMVPRAGPRSDILRTSKAHVRRVEAAKRAKRAVASSDEVAVALPV